MGDSIRLLQLVGTAVGRDTMAVGVEYHGGFDGIGLGSAMVVGVQTWRLRRISTGACVGKLQGCALVKSHLGVDLV